MYEVGAESGKLIVAYALQQVGRMVPLDWPYRSGRRGVIAGSGLTVPAHTMLTALSEFYFLAELGDVDVAPAYFVEGVAEVQLCLGFAVDEEDFLEFLFVLAADVVDHLAVVAMAGEGLDAAHLGTHLVLMAEDGDFFIATHNLGAEGLGFTIADAEDGGGGVFDIVGQMVFDTAGLHHA